MIPSFDFQYTYSRLQLAMQLIWRVDAINNMLPHENIVNYFKYGFIAYCKNMGGQM